MLGKEGRRGFRPEGRAPVAARHGGEDGNDRRARRISRTPLSARALASASAPRPTRQRRSHAAITPSLTDLAHLSGLRPRRAEQRLAVILAVFPPRLPSRARTPSPQPPYK